MRKYWEKPHMDLMDKLASLSQRYEDLNNLMAQPEVLEDIPLLQRYGREHAELQEVVQKYNELVATDRQIAEAREIYESEESDMRDLAFEEMERLKAQKERLLEEIKISLLPKDSMDEKNAIVTIQAGAGGDEAAIFAGELFRMYSRYADNRHWKIEILDINETAQNGIKDTDIRVDVYRSTGHGGQSVNTTDSAVRITHLPTGLVVTCQDEKSQLKNKMKALSVLRSRLWDLEEARRQEELSKTRRSQVQMGDRSEKIRTYNFPQDRVTDHRIGLTRHNLPGVLNGELDEFIDNLITVDQADKLQHLFEADVAV